MNTLTHIIRHFNADKASRRFERLVRHVTLDGQRYHVTWSPQFRQWAVAALDDGWESWVHPADVGFPTVRNVAIVAIEHRDRIQEQRKE